MDGRDGRMTDMIERLPEEKREILVSLPGGGARRYRVEGSGRVIGWEKAAPTPVVPVTLGLVDVQVNGFAGIDFNREDLKAADLDRALSAMLACGVTRCLPTIITAVPERMRARLRALDRAIWESRLGTLMVDGLHIEGPFLSPEDGFAGCHPKDAMQPASMKTFDSLVDGLHTPVSMVTVAPECEGALAFIRKATARGLIVAIGHTNATRAQVEEAAEAGARLSTHLGNAISHQLVKNENPLFAQLGEDRLFASFIADGIHIPVYMLQSWIRAKEVKRSVAVTDATAGAAAAPGSYTLGDVPIERCEDGVVREPGSKYLAGSSATMDGILRNLMAWFGFDLETALTVARTNPLHLLRRPAIPDQGDVAEFVWWRGAEDGLRVARAQVGPYRYHSAEHA